jgi:hypothetical protein
MHPKSHFIIGIIFIFFLHFIFPQITFLNLLIILFSSVLIDGDHYIYYILKKRDFNLIKCYNWYKEETDKTHHLPMSERKNRYTGFYLFHGIEILIILFLLGIYASQFFIFIFIGFSLHLFFDIIYEIYFKRTVHKISIIYSYYRWKKLEG